MNMTERHPLWDELEKEKVLLEEQEKRVFQQYRKLVDAVFAGEILDWREVEDILLKLIEFGDYYTPAWDLCTQLRRYIAKHFSDYVQMGDNFTRAIIAESLVGVLTTDVDEKKVREEMIARYEGTT
jgi:hypothetical protein